MGLNGFPRATKDVDYMVGPEAFATTSPFLVYREELAGEVTMGVVDLLAVPEAYPGLAAFLVLPQEDRVPVLPVEALILMKLDANRPHDRADVSRLLRAGASVAAVTRFLRAQAPALLASFGEIVEQTPGV
ncbi:MAG TPA: hypothetical protein QGF58_20295 [Myxococcota bacterium]|nr:hypothetical protein [Myxococcota bacterium]